MTTFYDMLVLNLQRFPENMKVNFQFDYEMLYSNPNNYGEFDCGKESFEKQMERISPAHFNKYVDVSYNCKGTRLQYDFYLEDFRVIDSKDVMTVGELLVILYSIKDKPHFLKSAIGYSNIEALQKLSKDLKNEFRIYGDNLEDHLHDDMSTCELDTKLEDLKEDEYFFTLEVSNPNLLTIDFKVYSSL